MIQPVQYIIADHSLGMSPGKLAAQVAHASVEGLRLNAKTEWGNPWDASIVNLWYRGGHYAKIVLESDDLPTAYAYLTARGFPCASIIDEGRTEFEKLTQTALGFPVVDKNSQHVRDCFGEFKLYGTAEREAFERKVQQATFYANAATMSPFDQPAACEGFPCTCGEHKRPKRPWYSLKR